MNGEALVSYAMHFIGVRYRWGGNNPVSGFDCSGFVCEILRSFGLIGREDLSAQMLFDKFAGQSARLDVPQSGHLLFFGRGFANISHVAIAINSKQMIEAGGGRSNTITKEDAANQNAFVRIRPIDSRSDLVSVVAL